MLNPNVRERIQRAIDCLADNMEDNLNVRLVVTHGGSGRVKASASYAEKACQGEFTVTRTNTISVVNY